eukprot:scaffold3713_cov372-Prasinococcus_capsulatus_cf.AAC.5
MMACLRSLYRLLRYSRWGVKCSKSGSSSIHFSLGGASSEAEAVTEIRWESAAPDRDADGRGESVNLRLLPVIVHNCDATKGAEAVRRAARGDVAVGAAVVLVTPDAEPDKHGLRCIFARDKRPGREMPTQTPSVGPVAAELWLALISKQTVPKNLAPSLP